MPLDERDAAHLWDMRDAAERLQTLARGVTEARFNSDPLFRLAVERLVQNIGEAATRVSSGARSDHNDIPCHRIIGQRNVLVHEYDKIESDLLWRTVVEDVSVLIQRLTQILDKEAPLNDQ